MLWLQQKCYDVAHVFSDRREFANLIEIALHNSRIEYLSLMLRPLDVLLLPNKPSLAVSTLFLHLREASSAGFLVDIISLFRKVQVRRGCLNCLTILSGSVSSLPRVICRVPEDPP